MREFKIDFKKEAFDDLKRRIGNTRFPDFQQAEGWELGTPMDYLKDVLAAWSKYYEGWKQQEICAMVGYHRQHGDYLQCASAQTERKRH